MIMRSRSGGDITASPRTRSLLARCAGVTCVLFISVLTARGSSIFDDDWTPPKPVARQQAGPPAPPTSRSSQTPPAGATSGTQAPTATPNSAPEARHPIPEKADQARSRKLLKEAFATQLKDRSLVGRKKLAKLLLDEAPKMVDNASDEYVLLGGAIEASEEAGALDLCFQAVDSMASHYEVDGLSIKTDAALKTNLRGDSPAAAAENVRRALHLVDVLAADEDFRAATQIITLARSAVVGNAQLTATVQQRSKEIEALRIVHDRVQLWIEKLKTSPDDGTANLSLGGYLCFDKAAWEKGLPMLAKGSDADLKRLATLELLKPGNTDDVIRLGDGWWAAAGRRPEATRGEILQHAASLYKTVVESTTGLKRSLLERRIADASAARDRALSESAGSRRLQLLPPGSDEIVIQKYVGEFLPDDRGPLFKTDEAEIPDVLAVSVKAGKIYISGTKKVEAPKVLGRHCGWLGKAVLLRLPEAKGTLTVSAIDADAVYDYLIMFVDKNGGVRFAHIKLKKGVSYTWALSQGDADATLTVSTGDDAVGTLTTPAADFRCFAFVAAIRTQGAHLEMKIDIGNPHGN